MHFRISVIIPCYNQSHFLAEAVESVLGQTHRDVEVIVVDDGSTDDTRQVAGRYESHITYIYQQNGGVSAARNTGIHYASGEFINFLDADDYLMPDMFNKVIERAKSEPSGDVFHGGWRTVDLEGKEITFYPAGRLPEDVFHAFLGGCFAACHALVIRASNIRAAGLFDTKLRACEDWDMWIRLAKTATRFVEVPGAIAVYRRYAGSTFSDANFERMWLSALQVLRKHERYHGHCDICRHAVKSRRRVMQGGFFADFYRVLGDYGSRGEWAKLLSYAARKVGRHPIWVAYLLREAVRCLRLQRTLSDATGAVHNETATENLRY